MTAAMLRSSSFLFSAVMLLQALLAPSCGAEILSDRGREPGGEPNGQQASASDALAFVQSSRPVPNEVWPAPVSITGNLRGKEVMVNPFLVDPTSTHVGQYIVTVGQVGRRFSYCIYWVPIVIFAAFPALLIATYFWK
mmetsp:Transcript_43215/g.98103  ORF Transcript_43215/g.98103 Transcript_43215/m.98103 type:complete len:138 (-) Transcript_43215:83-496(-)